MKTKRKKERPGKAEKDVSLLSYFTDARAKKTHALYLPSREYDGRMDGAMGTR